MAAMADLAPSKPGANRVFSSALRSEAATQGVFAAPAVGGAVLTLNQWVMIATLVYLVLQIAFLAWKWRREWISTHEPESHPSPPHRPRRRTGARP